MTPLERLVYTKSFNYETILHLLRQYKVEKIPILNEDQSIAGLVIFKNLLYFHTNLHIATLDKNRKLMVGAASGLQDYLHHAKSLVEAGADILCLDVANGHSTRVGNAIQEIKKHFPHTPLIAGNECTPEGYEYLCQMGADCIRVGIGNGSICSTRLETGIGMCQFSALLHCSPISKKYNVPMISDGGHCGKVGNKFKAIAAGSACVLLGRSLAGTTESPGQIIFKNGRRFKYYRGMASSYANISKQERTGVQNVSTGFHVEGVEGEVEYKGEVKNQIDRICNGMRSGVSYLGVSTIQELHSIDLQITKISASGFNETKTRM